MAVDASAPVAPQELAVLWRIMIFRHLLAFSSSARSHAKPCVAFCTLSVNFLMVLPEKFRVAMNHCHTLATLNCFLVAVWSFSSSKIAFFLESYSDSQSSIWHFKRAFSTCSPSSAIVASKFDYSSIFVLMDYALIGAFSIFNRVFTSRRQHISKTLVHR